MSANDLQLDKSQSYNLANIVSSLALVDVNVVLCRVIQKLSPELRNEVVLRCDELSQVKGFEPNIENAFSQLLQLIVDEKPEGRKLFLHITSSPDRRCKGEAIDLGLQRYTIKFHTNISLHAASMQESKYRINSIASLLVPFSGSLQVNQLKNSGCVFSISLPGK